MKKMKMRREKALAFDFSGFAFSTFTLDDPRKIERRSNGKLAPALLRHKPGEKRKRRAPSVNANVCPALLKRKCAKRGQSARRKAKQAFAFLVMGRRDEAHEFKAE